MHLPDTYNPTEELSSGTKGDLEVVLAEYHKCIRQQLSLQTSLLRILDTREREAERNLSAAKEQLEYVRNLRQGIREGASSLEESRTASSPVPNRMEATTWRWFHEHSDENTFSGPDSILSDVSVRRSYRELEEGNVSQDTIRERPFDYLAMKNEPSDDRIIFSNSDNSSVGSEHPDASVELTASLGSLANSFRFNVGGPGTAASMAFGLGTEPHLSPVVTVNRESLATLLNAFDRILNGRL